MFNRNACVTPWLIHVNVWQKPQYYKVIRLQLKINWKKRNACVSLTKGIYKNAYNSTAYNRYTLETVQMPINSRMDIQTVVYSWAGILCNNEDRSTIMHTIWWMNIQTCQVKNPHTQVYNFLQFYLYKVDSWGEETVYSISSQSSGYPKEKNILERRDKDVWGTDKGKLLTLDLVA